MKEVFAQFKKEGFPFTPDAYSTLCEAFKHNQWVKLKCYRVEKGMEPSIAQHGTLFACFNMVLENNDKPHMQTLHGVKEACKVDIDFRDPGFIMVRPDGGIQLRYRSYSFKELPPGRERDIVMQQSFEWCAETLGYEDGSEMTAVEKMIEEAKSRMLSVPR